ncbi:hypothetical protein M9H77_22756 [Catharanthus roseus]|uniref:Uncharacterized protein n=1 Tax=Catharanthus roseus TaxID=4058 RepID=A0ACC0AR30_CATRO|nr:hypothetical protein M9H77_22756 [Catharanthus roseus]
MDLFQAEMRAAFEQLCLIQEIHGSQLAEILVFTHRYADELAYQRTSIDRQEVMLAPLYSRFLLDQGSNAGGGVNFGPINGFYALVLPNKEIKVKMGKNGENGSTGTKEEELPPTKPTTNGRLDLLNGVGPECSSVPGKNPTADGRDRPTGQDHLNSNCIHIRFRERRNSSLKAIGKPLVFELIYSLSSTTRGVMRCMKMKWGWLILVTLVDDKSLKLDREMLRVNLSKEKHKKCLSHAI